MSEQLTLDIAAIIRRVDGNHTMGAGDLAEHIVNELLVLNRVYKLIGEQSEMTED